MSTTTLSQVVRERIHQDSRLAMLLETMEREYPFFIQSITNSFESDPELFCAIGEEICLGLSETFPMFDAADFSQYYADFTIEQNRHQRTYVRTGVYLCSSHEQANLAVYQNADRMRSYMIAALLTHFLWPHHLSIFRFFMNDFVQEQAPGVQIVREFAPGHGYFGRKSLAAWANAKLTGIDISAEAVAMSVNMATHSPVANRVSYIVGNALDWEGPSVDRVIAGELLEHLDQPQILMDAVYQALRPGGTAFVTAALTAAQMDHVTEFKTSEEVFKLAQNAGLDLVKHLEAGPQIVPKDTDKIPRVLAMVLRRPAA
jgi:2-polyprenyl-3-methyl-5-hydroxy-6-metoxy-1,4-benzoquinol methylase